MKRFASFFVLVFTAAFFMTAGAVLAADADFHIGIVTGTVSQSEDSLRGAERMIQEYGDSSKGGMITHVTYPDNFMSEMETTIGVLAGLAKRIDPSLPVKSVVRREKSGVLKTELDCRAML